MFLCLNVILQVLNGDVVFFKQKLAWNSQILKFYFEFSKIEARRWDSSVQNPIFVYAFNFLGNATLVAGIML